MSNEYQPSGHGTGVLPFPQESPAGQFEQDVEPAKENSEPPHSVGALPVLGHLYPTKIKDYKSDFVLYSDQTGQIRHLFEYECQGLK